MKINGQSTQSNTQAAGIKEQSPSPAYTVKSFQALSAGEKFTATVSDIKPNSVTLRLYDGSEINAKSLILPDAHIGDEAIFMVKENFKGQILLEMVKQDPSVHRAAIIDEALEAASLPMTDENRSIVLSLMENNLSIDAETLRKAAFFKYSQPKIDIEKMIFLLKEDFPASEKTVRTLAALTGAQEAEISAGAAAPPPENTQKLNVQIADIIDDIAVDILREITEGLQGADLQSLPVSDGQTAGENPSIITGKQADIKQLTDIFLGGDGLQNDDNVGIIKAQTERLLSGGSVEDAEKLVKSLAAAIKQRLTIPLDRNDRPDINRFYKELSSITEKLQDYYDQPEKRENRTVIVEKLQALEEKVSFMNHVKHTKEYFQIPFSVNGQENTGEIHIYKKAKKYGMTGGSASVLIALDTYAIGHVDIFINKNASQLSLQFRSDLDSTLKLINKNAPKLAQMLNEKGLSIASVSYKQSDERFDAASPQEDEPKKEQSRRYTFDMRI